MADVVVDPDALRLFVGLGGHRIAFEADVERTEALRRRVVNLSPDHGVAATSLDQLTDLLLAMERHENTAAAIRDAVLLADDDGGDRLDDGRRRADSTLVEALLASQPSGLLWDYDTEIAVVAAESGLAYDEAYFGTRAHQIDVIDRLVETSEPGRHRDQLLSDRELLIDDLTMGDPQLTAAIAGLLDDNGSHYTAADAVFDAPAVVHADSSIAAVLTAIEPHLPSDESGRFNPFLIGLGSVLASKVEAFTGADAAVVDPAIAAWAEASGVTYNEIVVHLRQEAEQGPSLVAPDLLDVDVSTVDEAAALLTDRAVFEELETAEAGRPGPLDGCLGADDISAVIASPSWFSPRAVRIARFLDANPQAFAQLDTARDGTFLRTLADGRYHAGAGDGVISYADVGQHRLNRWLFATLASDLDALDADGNGLLTEPDFQARLDDLDIPANVRSAVQQALDTGAAGGGDDRPLWVRTVWSTARVASMVNTPLLIGRAIIDRDGLGEDGSALIRGAGGAVVGLAQFGYDIAATPAGPLYDMERRRVDDDPQAHRGLRLAAAVPTVYDAAASIAPGNHQFGAAIEAVRYQGTIDAHPGVGLALDLADAETFLDDPGAWLGAFVPDLVITAISGGSGAAARGARSAARIAAAGRRLLARLGLRAPATGMGLGVDTATLGLRAVAERPLTGSNTLARLAERMVGYVRADRVSRLLAGPIDFTRAGDGFGVFIARRSDVDPGDYLDVVGHGNETAIEIFSDDRIRLAGAAETASIIRSSPTYRPGQPIRLLSCSTGELPDGFAARLARELNAVVVAPNDLIWALDDGSSMVSRSRVVRDVDGTEVIVPVEPPTGGWMRFYPNGHSEPVHMTTVPQSSFWFLAPLGALIPDPVFAVRSTQVAVDAARRLFDDARERPTPQPPIEPPPGMGPALVERRQLLVDPVQIEQFDTLFERLGPRLLPSLGQPGSDATLGQLLERAWRQEHPTVGPPNAETEALVDRLVDLAGHRQRLINDLLEFHQSHPRIVGAEQPLVRLSSHLQASNRLLSGDGILDASTVSVLTSELDGIDQFVAVLRDASDVVALSPTVVGSGHEDRVDLVAEGGDVWIDIVDGDGIEARARRLVAIASDSRHRVDGRPPTIALHLRDGVSPTVVGELQRLGHDTGIPIVIRTIHQEGSP